MNAGPLKRQISAAARDREGHQGREPGRGSPGELLNRCLTDARWFWAALLLAYLELVVARSLAFAPQSDVQLYHRTIQALWAGQMPYRDFAFEYPPYILVWLVLPGCFQDLRHFQIAFGLELLLVDAALKILLVWLGLRRLEGARLFLPVLLFSLAGAFNSFFYLQRLDLIPAALSLALLLAFWREQYFLAGLLLAFGAGCKLYPLLFLPPLLVLAWRRERALGFLGGMVWGFLPLVFLSPYLPWWDFLAFHEGRGLQVESLYASLLWLLYRLGCVAVSWHKVRAWFEVGGTAAQVVLPFAQATFLLTMVGAVGLAAWRACQGDPADLASLARLLLIPLVAFVAFNVVFSAQYVIWLVVLAAVAAFSGPLRPSLGLIVAALLVPLFFPAPDYGGGLTLFPTLALCARNLLLIAVWIELVRTRPA